MRGYYHHQVATASKEPGPEACLYAMECGIVLCGAQGESRGVRDKNAARAAIVARSVL